MAVLLAANASFIPGSPLHITNPELSAFRWGAEELNDRIVDYGYGGIELHWSNVFQHCRELRDADPAEAQVLARHIVSAHEGWRGTADPMPANPTETPVRALRDRGSLAVRIGSAVLFPTGAASLDQLEAVEQKLDLPDPWHYVLFPDQRGDKAADQAKTRRFPNSSIQPTVDVGACWGARSFDDFVEELSTRGYKATIDSFHISRAGKVVRGRANWRALAGRLLDEGLVPEIHVSAGRTDFANVDPERHASSMKELQALIDNGNLDGTPLGELGEMLRDRKWTGNVVIEATIPGISAALKERGNKDRLTPKLFDQLQRNMTRSVKRWLPHVTWNSPGVAKSARHTRT